MTISFSLNPADLTAGIGSVQNALASATELRIYHSSSANFPNSVTSIPQVTANLGSITSWPRLRRPLRSRAASFSWVPGAWC